MPNTSYDKNDWRRRTIAFLIRVFGSPLPCDYMELFGESGIESFDLFQREGLLRTPDQFIGVDVDARLLLAHSQRDRTNRPCLLMGDGYSHALRLAAENTAAFNFDTLNATGRPYWDKHGPILQRIVQASMQNSGQCALIFNHQLGVNRSSRPPSEWLMEHLQAMCGVFSPWNLQTEQILGPKTHHLRKVVQGFEGYAGAVDIYRSSDHIWRMATVRIYFENRRAYVDQEC